MPVVTARPAGNRPRRIRTIHHAPASPGAACHSAAKNRNSFRARSRRTGVTLVPCSCSPSRSVLEPLMLLSETEVVMFASDFDALARAVDERVLDLPEGCDPARAFGVRLRADGFVLVPFWSGVARELRYGATPPDGC